MTDWCKISSLCLVPVSDYWTWTKTTPQRKQFFWSNPYKIKVMITSLTEMLEFPNFGHMTKSTINLNHVIKICWWCHEQKLWHHNLYFKIFILRRSGVAIFVDIMKIVTMFIKSPFEDSRKVKRIRNYVTKWNLYLYFLI